MDTSKLIKNAAKEEVKEYLRMGNKIIEGSKDELIEILTTGLQENINSNPNYISNLKKSITLLKSNINQPARIQYQKFLIVEKSLFNLTQREQIPTELLVIADNNEQNRFTYNADIQNSLGVGTSSHIYRTTNEIRKGYQQLNNAELLLEHLNKYKKQISDQGLEKKIFTKREKENKKAGIIAEAFVRHVAQRHTELLKNSVTDKTIGQINEDFGNIKEELIMAKKNNRIWSSGGDVIVKNEDNEIILNIQVKNTITKANRVGSLSYKKIIENLDKIYNLLNTNNSENQLRKIATNIYNLFATSPVITQTIEKIGNNLDK